MFVLIEKAIVMHINVSCISINNQGGRVTHFVALLDYRSIQLLLEAFWSAPVDNTIWKWTINREVPDNMNL